MIEEDKESGEQVLPGHPEYEPEVTETEMDWIREMKALKINFSEVAKGVDQFEWGQDLRVYIGYCHRLINSLFIRYKKQKLNNRLAGRKSTEVRRTRATSIKEKFQKFYLAKSDKKILDLKISDASIINQFREKNPDSPSAVTLRKYIPKK